MKILYVNKLLNTPNAEAGIFPDKKGQSPKHFNKTYIYLISMETKLLQNAFFHRLYMRENKPNMFTGSIKAGTSFAKIDRTWDPFY